MTSREVDALCADPVYVLRLQQRVATYLVSRPSSDGSPKLEHTFTVLDATHRGSLTEDTDLSRELVTDEMALQAILRPIFPLKVLSDRDVAALSHLLFSEDESDDEGGGVHSSWADARRSGGGRASRLPAKPPALAASYLLQLRQMTPLIQFQTWEAVQRARAVVQALDTLDPFESRVLDVANAEADGVRTAVPILPEEAQSFLELVCGLSGSAGELVTQSCTVRGAVTDSLDAGRFHDLVFSDAVPAEIEFTFLAHRFAESTASAVPRRGGGATAAPATGSLALCCALRDLPLAATCPRGASAEQAMDFNGVPVEARLTSRLFFRLCMELGTGFVQEEADKLFFYLYNERGRREHDATNHPLVPVRGVVRMFRQHFPAVPLSLVHVIRCAVAKLVALSVSDGTAFFRLYKHLAPYGVDRVPLAEYVAALRACGVSEQAASDLHLEWLRLEGGTRVELLSILCIPPPAAREAIISKLFERLAADASATTGPSHSTSSTVRATDVLARFDPDRMEGKPARALGQRWQAILAEYIAEVELDALTYPLFAFVWSIISAGVEDDALFTMSVWQGFRLADRGVTTRRGVRS